MPSEADQHVPDMSKLLAFCLSFFDICQIAPEETLQCKSMIAD